LTKLGRLVKYNKITSLEEIFRFAIPIKEAEIIDHIMKQKEIKLSEEVMKICPVQKQTQAGQRTRFKAWVVVGDNNGHIGMGIKVAKEVQIAIKGAIIAAKLNIVPIRRGYWGNRIGNPHTIQSKVTGKSGSVRVRMVPAPRGTGLVAAGTSKKVLQFAGIQDVYTQCKGNTKTKGNFIAATYDALVQTYRYLTPDLWGKSTCEPTPFEVYAGDLKLKDKKDEPRGGDRGSYRR